MSQTQSPFTPGTTISSRYEIQKVLGAGGMGQVVQAMDRSLENEMVALKMLYTHLVKDPVTFARFRNEVLVTRQLSHPNIVKLFDFGKASEEVFYISMEYVAGQSLGKLISDSRLKPIPFHEMIRILIAVGNGVSHAHAKGIVHRDLKPDNILLGENNDVKVTDFGLARTVHVDKGFTNTGEAVGTPYYMAPEQVRGDEVDGRCDIYALGIIMFELATGRRPFNDDSWFNLAAMHLREPLPSFANKQNGIPKWYEKLAQRAAAKKEEDRFESVEDFIAELEKHQDGQPVRIKRQSAIHSLYNKPIQRRRPIREKLGWVTISVLVVILSVFVVRFTPVIKDALGGVVLKTESATGTDLSTVKSAIGTGQVMLKPEEYFKRIATDDSAAVSVLLAAGIDPNTRDENGDTGLIVAARDGKSKVVELLISAHADIDATDSEGKTALMHSMVTSNNSMIFSLIDAGAEINMRDNYGRTPLIYAILNLKQQVITALRKRGAAINEFDFAGMTALHHAVKKNNIPMVRMLLEEGEQTADPNIADEAGNTPLITASSIGSSDIVRQLINHGAKVTTANKKGETAIQVATKVVKDILRQYETPGKKAGEIITLHGDPDADSSDGETKGVSKSARNAAPGAAKVEGDSRNGATGGVKMTRLRVSGKPTATWKLGKTTLVSDMHVTVRNVGDYAATGVVVQAVIPGGKKVAMMGPETLERNGTFDFILKDEQTASSGGELKADITCDNCYR